MKPVGAFCFLHHCSLRLFLGKTTCRILRAHGIITRIPACGHRTGYTFVIRAVYCTETSCSSSASPFLDELHLVIKVSSCDNLPWDNWENQITSNTGATEPSSPNHLLLCGSCQLSSPPPRAQRAQTMPKPWDASCHSLNPMFDDNLMTK